MLLLIQFANGEPARAGTNVQLAVQMPNARPEAHIQLRKRGNIYSHTGRPIGEEYYPVSRFPDPSFVFAAADGARAIIGSCPIFGLVRSRSPHVGN